MTITRVRTTPMATAARSPRASPLTAVAIATQNSTRLSCQNRTNSDGLIRPRTATMTRQPRVASGRSLSTPARNSAQPTARTTVTSSLSCVRAPARWLMAVWENPPAAGMAWKRAPATQATPLAASSWSLSMGGSLGPAHVARDRHRLEEAHQRDGDGPGRHQAQVVEGRGLERRQIGGHRGDEGHAVVVERREGHQPDPRRDGDEGAGTVGEQAGEERGARRWWRSRRRWW